MESNTQRGSDLEEVKKKSKFQHTAKYSDCCANNDTSLRKRKQAKFELKQNISLHNSSSDEHKAGNGTCYLKKKTRAEYQRAYRQRIKENNTPSQTKISDKQKIRKAANSKAYRERRKRLREEGILLQAQRSTQIHNSDEQKIRKAANSKAYRERKKRLRREGVLTKKFSMQESSILQSQRSETSNASPAGELETAPSAAADRRLCCCCLLSAGAAPLCGAVGPDGAGYADLLRDCFHITYPEEVQATATICSECIATLNDGVGFKRRVLECQSTMATFQRTDIMQVHVKQEPPTETYNITYEDYSTTIIKEEPVDTDNAGFEVQTIDATAHNDLLCERVNFLDKIQEAYDLSNNGDDDETQTDIEIPVDANEHIKTPIFAELLIDQSTIMSESAQLTTEEEEFLQKGCECGELCHKKFSRFEIIAFRRECVKYHSDGKCDTNHMDIFLTGALACIYDRSIPQSGVHLKFRGMAVCESFFMFVFVLNKKQYNNIHRKIIDRATYQWTCQSLSEQPYALKFIRVYSMQNSLILPGRFSNRYPDLHILPKNTTKSSVYCEYTKVCVAMKHKFINQTLWNKLWEQLCPYIVHKMPSRLCQMCHENSKWRSKAGVLSQGLNTEVLQRCLQHLQHVSDERAYYERVMVRPAVGDGTLHCSIDFLQRLHLPYEPAAGPLNFLDAYGVALFAVACPPPGETVVYVVPERVGDDSMNITLSLLHHFLESKSHADVQCHCGPLLRADRVLQYAAWRGARAGRCRLAFLPPGHDTRVDCLGVLKPALRSRPARRVQELCDVLAATGLTAVPVATETGDPNVPIYDWLAYFDERNPAPVSDIQNYCHFEANSSCSGVIKCKASVMSDSSDDLFVFSKSLVGVPEVLPPAELSAERRKYLTEKVQQHLEENEVLIELKVEPVDEVQEPLELINEEIKMEFEDHNVG